MRRMSPKFTAPIVFITVALVAATAHAAARPSAQKIDKSVKRAVAAGVARQRVIITANPGCRDAVRQTLQLHSAAIVREYGLIDAFNSDISSADVSEYAPEQIAHLDPEQLAIWISAAPDPQRSALALFYLDEFSYREIMSMLELKLGELAHAIAFGRREFQAWLNAAVPGPAQ